VTSEIQTSDAEEWLKLKAVIGQGLGDIIAFTRQKLKDLIPTIRVIKDRKLWKHGDYASFDECQLVNNNSNYLHIFN